MSTQVTVESIRPMLDLDRVHDLLAQIEQMSGYERRLIAMGLLALNKDAPFLPPKSKELLWEVRSGETRRV